MPIAASHTATALGAVERRPRRSLYLELDGGPIRAVLHSPDGSAEPRTGVVLCPPFGWEELWVYRGYTAWADTLAAAGHAALRFDLPGTGESAGGAELHRFDLWLGAIAGCASYLRGAAGCERIAGIGVGLGGMLALRAVADGAPLDDLVLWSVPARGRALLREAKVYARYVDAASLHSDEPREQEQADGSLDLGGFVLGVDVVRRLDALDLAVLRIPDARRRRVLLLGRDALPIDQRLRAQLERSGAAVATTPGDGYAEMVGEAVPGEAGETIATTMRWLAAAEPARAAPTGGERVGVSEHAELTIDGARVREQAFEIAHGGALARGVLATPAGVAASEAPLCAVILNGSWVRRIGPRRMWVEASRRWAARGVPTLRIDALGLGESDGDGAAFRASEDAFYGPEMTAQAIAALDRLENSGLPARFLLGGLCSGAYTSLQAALQDERIVANLMVNPGIFEWRSGRFGPWGAEPGLRAYARTAARLLRSRRVGELTRHLGHGGLTRRLRRALRQRARDLAASLGIGERRRARRLARLHRRGALTFIVTGRDEGADTVLDRRDSADGPWPGVSVERLPIHDHMFVLAEQRDLAFAAFDRALDAALAALAGRTV